MINKAFLFAALAIIGTASLKAQMNVGSTAAPDPSAMLQVSGTLKGFLPPVLTQTQRDALLSSSPVKGLVIFNSTSNQLEVNTGTPASPIWTSTTGGNNTVVLSQPVDVSRLGYSPSSSATAASAVASFTAADGVVYTKLGSYTSTVTNHSYAIYRGGAAGSGAASAWFGAYFAAKSLGGYLGTFTSFAEWNSVYTNLLSPYGASNTMWIGLAKRSWRAGTSDGAAPLLDIVDWITGEHPSLDYTTSSTNNIWLYQNFNSGEPNNYTTGEGFVQLLPTTYGQYSSANGTSAGTLYAWNDLPAANAQNGFLIEFNQ